MDDKTLAMLETAVADSVVQCPECGYGPLEPDYDECPECDERNPLVEEGLI